MTCMKPLVFKTCSMAIGSGNKIHVIYDFIQKFSFLLTVGIIGKNFLNCWYRMEAYYSTAIFIII